MKRKLPTQVDVIKTTGMSSAGCISKEEQEKLEYAMDLGLLATFDDSESANSCRWQDVTLALEYVDKGIPVPEDLLKRIREYKTKE